MHTTRRVLVVFAVAGIVASSVTTGRPGHLMWLLTAVVWGAPRRVRAWRGRAAPPPRLV